MLTFAFMHHPYLVCILFDMPSLHLFTFVMFFFILLLLYRATAVTTEIPLKECSAYGQVDQGGGGEREQPHIYERPQ